MKPVCLIKKYTQGHIVAYMVALLLGISVQVLTLLQPKYSGELIAGVEKHVSITKTTLFLGMLIIIGVVLTAVQQALLGVIGEKTVRDVRMRMTDRFFGMSLLARETNPPAWYSQRITNDAELIKSIPTEFLSLLQGVILLLGSGLALLKLNPIFF
ncbi:ABC-type multidrug transport system fused ATPase/permease subunit [Bifidobacterium commune]|uniref:ABC transporter transmembrane region n=1 Tax=Bifidobacterium commune TaxID=1505727 RepID=A0A1C4H501_9BIFI|nr:ABC transporter transmembrane domain-containing protein [Bifidobacterium commune]MBB2955785.1 ABC-type multidrug transport system fused ATPase/permease subunit [Bifidobacterium commune]SCC80059.1 ABC transporter transmembrane region [Bifidobacterium commune]